MADEQLVLLASRGESLAWKRSNASVIAITNTFLEYLLATAAHPLHGKGYPATYDAMTAEQAINPDFHAGFATYVSKVHTYQKGGRSKFLAPKTAEQYVRQLLNMSKQRFATASRDTKDFFTCLDVNSTS